MFTLALDGRRPQTDTEKTDGPRCKRTCFSSSRQGACPGRAASVSIFCAATSGRSPATSGRATCSSAALYPSSASVQRAPPPCSLRPDRAGAVLATRRRFGVSPAASSALASLSLSLSLDSLDDESSLCKTQMRAQSAAGVLKNSSRANSCKAQYESTLAQPRALYRRVPHGRDIDAQLQCWPTSASKSEAASDAPSSAAPSTCASGTRCCVFARYPARHTKTSRAVAGL